MDNLIYQENRKVAHGDCNPSGELRISSLLSYAQNIASDHVNLLGLGSDKTYEKGILWVVAKMHFEIERMPHYDEPFRFLTWPNNCIHFIFPRNYEIMDASGPIIRGSSYWTLIDAKARSIVMPDKLGVFPGTATGTELEMPPVLRADFSLTQKASIKATWSHCDMNGHLNNTRYFDLIEDLIDPSYLKSHTPKTIDVTYKKEIKMGEEIEIDYGFNGDTFACSCPNFIIKIEYRPI